MSPIINVLNPQWMILLVGSIMFLSTFVRSAIGFGNALLAMPILAWVIGIHTATPLVAIISWSIGIVILLRTWRSVDFHSARQLILLSLLGIPCGVVLLVAAPEATVKKVLGIILVVHSLYNLFAPELPVVRYKPLTPVCGLLAGVLGGAYNTNGPPVVIYGLLRQWSPAQFRATLQYYFSVTGVFILIGHASAGLWTPTVLRLYLLCIPSVIAGIVLGNKMNQRLPHNIFRRLISVVLLVIGMMYLV